MHSLRSNSIMYCGCNVFAKTPHFPKGRRWLTPLITTYNSPLLILASPVPHRPRTKLTVMLIKQMHWQSVPQYVLRWPSKWKTSGLVSSMRIHRCETPGDYQDQHYVGNRWITNSNCSMNSTTAPDITYELTDCLFHFIISIF